MSGMTSLHEREARMQRGGEALYGLECAVCSINRKLAISLRAAGERNSEPASAGDLT